MHPDGKIAPGRVVEDGRELRQVQRLAGVVFVFFQNPGDGLAAAIGEGNAIKLILDNRGGFGGSLNCGNSGSTCNGRSRGLRAGGSG